MCVPPPPPSISLFHFFLIFIFSLFSLNRFDWGKTETRWGRKTSEWGREYIIVWKRNLRGRKKKREENRKKKREEKENPERRKEPWRALPETHVRWKTLFGGMEREARRFIFFLLSVLPHFFFQSPPNIENGRVRNICPEREKKGPPQLIYFFFLSFAGIYIRSSSSFSFSVLLILALSLLPLSYWGMKSYSHTEEPVKRRGNGKKRLAQEGRLGNSEQAMGLHIHSGCWIVKEWREEEKGKSPLSLSLSLWNLMRLYIAALPGRAQAEGKRKSLFLPVKNFYLAHRCGS